MPTKVTFFHGNSLFGIISLTMRARFGERQLRTSSKRAKIEPFVIFCLHQREDLAARHPTFTSGQLTSTLGAMWRDLSAVEKQEYVGIARREAVEPTLPRKRQRRIAMADREAANARDSGPGNEPERVFTFARPPYLWVIPRGAFGASAAAASQSAFAGEIASTASISQ
jgi:hypothetical protein